MDAFKTKRASTGKRPIRCAVAPWLLAAMAPLSTGVTATAGSEANGSESCDGLFTGAHAADLEHAWSEVPILREMERDCASSRHKAFYWQIRAEAESLIGNHRMALADADRSTKASERAELPTGAASKPALRYIIERAADHRFVMVNERHHVSTERLLTLDLLAPLYEQGFRYLGVEALSRSERGINERGYPIRETGFYINDVIFAELLREAIALGYELVPYEASQEQGEATETLNDQQARDYWQARNLIAATLDRDPTAKVLVHCGYGHLNETVSARWTPMAHYLREATGFDPLTVDQTLLSERGSERAEHGLRVSADERGLVEDRPVVLLDAAGDLLPQDDDSVDIRVVGLRTRYVNGRPAWMRMGGRRAAVAIDTPECADEACIVAALDTRWEQGAVPYDRVEVVEAGVDMYLPAGAEVELKAYRLDGSKVFERALTTPP